MKETAASIIEALGTFVADAAAAMAARIMADTLEIPTRYGLFVVTGEVRRARPGEWILDRKAPDGVRQVRRLSKTKSVILTQRQIASTAQPPPPPPPDHPRTRALAVLGFRVGAKPTPAQIRRAYLDLIRRHHPDRDGGNHDRAAAITAAYRTLMGHK